MRPSDLPDNLPSPTRYRTIWMSDVPLGTRFLWPRVAQLFADDPGPGRLAAAGGVVWLRPVSAAPR